MPQFDVLLFFNQVFWLTFLFFSFYTILVRRYLPITISALKVRKKKIVEDKFFLGRREKEVFFISNKTYCLWHYDVLSSFIGKD
jgi:hypothetical protein